MTTNRIRLAQNEPLDLVALLHEHGIEATFVTNETDLYGARLDTLPALVLLDISLMRKSEIRHCVRRCRRLKLSIIALVPDNLLGDLSAILDINDFMVSPPRTDELVARAKRALRRAKLPEGSDAIQIGELVINPTRYEVSLEGRRVNLRFKEYELLRLLAANPGRVYTREALLNQIWGYDYFGGTRTVDVHVRRLRSKIEDAGNSFIETIWNVGYRFRDIES